MGIKIDKKEETLPGLGQRKGQVTIFIIVGVLIIAGIILIFSLGGSGSGEEDLSPITEPIYASFLSCLEEETSLGVEFLQTQGGYIELPDLELGSFYMPFSSQLNFFGTKIPYWYYVSGNNIQKERVPTKAMMEEELSTFIEERISNCNLETYVVQGFEIRRGVPQAGVSIGSGEVSVDLDMVLTVSNGEETAVVEKHRAVVRTNLGSLYDSALDVYKKEQEELFLEGYGLDILGLYAPVDGVEITCSPLSWGANEVFETLRDAVETNTLALKTDGPRDDYFVVKGIDADVRFINSKDWAYSYEVNPSEGPLMISTPVGNQPGLGILGFCYVDYHFVYNMAYPVLVQVWEGDEFFQFPVAVVIRGNKAREALDTNAAEGGIPEFCQHKNTEMEIRVYDIEGRPIDADVSYECSNTNCLIGRTEHGVLVDKFPQCVNGRISVRAEGYEDVKETFTVITSNTVEVYLTKKYPIEVRLRLDQALYNGNAVVSFISNESTKTIFYPDQKEVELTEGQYEVQVQIYRESSLTLGSSVREQCVEVPRGGIGGIFGMTEKRCFDIEIPEQLVSNALSGGGKQGLYISSGDLNNFNVIEINSEALAFPVSLDQLQLNYILVEEKGLEIDFV
ncbi:MAG: hypothetical protein KKB31_06570 [Nanoarchaeota archaeon]|nr:hypothetical protein [Nanoarchaeota archaeon]